MMKVGEAGRFLQWSLVVLFGTLTLMTMGLTELVPLSDWMIRALGIVALVALPATAYGFVRDYSFTESDDDGSSVRISVTILSLSLS